MAQKRAFEADAGHGPPQKRSMTLLLDSTKDDSGVVTSSGRHAIRATSKASQSAMTNAEDPYFCSRCDELGISRIWLDLIKDSSKLDLGNMGEEHRNMIFQRKVFDIDIPPLDDCCACQKLQLNWPGTITSPVNDGSWLDFTVNGIIRCTTFEKRGNFGTIIIGGGAPKGYCKTDILEPRLPNGSFEPSKTSSYARKIARRSIDYSILEQMLLQCINNHDLCRPVRHSDLHLINLIDVRKRELVKYPSHESCNYAALSYVWGPTRALRFRMGPLRTHLPATIEDAIQVVLKLGLRYLWVDAVCINQVDDVEKLKQISIMRMIYYGAFTTIVALDGKDAASGLPEVKSNNPRLKQRTVPLGLNQLVSTLPPLSRVLEQSTWDQQGWTYQEAELSHRLLYFSNHQVYFKCKACLSSEVSCSELSQQNGEWEPSQYISRDYAASITGPTMEKAQGFKLLSTIAESYSKREFTEQRDVVYAFMGIVQRLEEQCFSE